MNFKEHLAADRRLCILRILAETGGSANDSVLHTALESIGHRRQSRATIREDIRFLVASGLCTDEWLEHIQIVNITQRGVDVAEGREEAAGVKKPGIGG